MRIHNPEVNEKKRINYIRLNSGISNDCLYQRPCSLSSYAFLESIKIMFLWTVTYVSYVLTRYMQFKRLKQYIFYNFSLNLSGFKRHM